MHQVKIFKTVESELADLEKEVNAWIRESGARIVNITGNIAPQSGAPGSRAETLGGVGFAASDVVLIVLYEAPTP